MIGLDRSQEHLKLLAIDEVIEQIIIDIENGDLTALQELLLNIDLKTLQAYLPEEKI